jgi:RNA polymerase sigma-70 factor (ECF subfamily)
MPTWLSSSGARRVRRAPSKNCTGCTRHGCSGWRAASSAAPESALGTWLFRLATNLCLDHLRSRGARLGQLTDTLEDEPEATAPGAGPVIGAVDRVDLERALASLPAGCRTVFVLHDVEGCEHREIASLLGISDGTSKSQLHKARLRLRRLLAGDAAPAAREMRAHKTRIQ